MYYLIRIRIRKLYRLGGGAQLINQAAGSGAELAMTHRVINGVLALAGSTNTGIGKEGLKGSDNVNARVQLRKKSRGADEGTESEVEERSRSGRGNKRSEVRGYDEGSDKRSEGDNVK